MNERVLFVRNSEVSYYMPMKIDVDKLVCSACDKLIANDPARGYEQADEKVILVHEYCGDNPSEILPLNRIHPNSHLKSVPA